ncbi:MAG: hypothetical protein AB4290_11155 [Spirulina sp.]
MNKCDPSPSVLFPLLLFLVLIVLPLQGGCASREDNRVTPTPVSPVQSSPSDASHGTMRRIPASVETVEVNVMESQPLQLSLTVTGNFQDGCQAPLKMEQHQDGDRIKITLYRELPADVLCPAVLVPFQETVLLEGRLASETYTLDVNGVIVEETM